MGLDVGIPFVDLIDVALADEELPQFVFSLFVACLVAIRSLCR